MELQSVIGLEVHAQMNTATKMFCGCDNDAWGKPPNTTVCPVCMGHPGTLPVVNRAAVEKAIRMSKALGCTVNAHNHFDRKNYFYPDLPAGFQISQYQHPLAVNGSVAFGAGKTCGIHRLHLENDAGKLTHIADGSLCDYNRAGTPLMEIVTEPELHSPDDAVAFAQELRRILIATDSSEADMYKGMMRFDASVSLRREGETVLNPRVEIKNLNSFKSLERALTYQIALLKKQWKEGKQPQSEVTVGWIDDRGTTVLLREKESAADYRYFPEPDIPPLVLSDAFLEGVTSALTVLPSERKQQYLSLGLTEAEAIILVDDAAVRTLFDAVFSETNDAKRASSLVLTQLVGFLKERGKTVAEGPPPADVVFIAKAIVSGHISTNAGKEVLQALIDGAGDPKNIIKERGLAQVSDESAILALVDQAIAAHPQAIEAYKAGKTSALGPIVGWVMKQSKGAANPGMVSTLLTKRIG